MLSGGSFLSYVISYLFLKGFYIATFIFLFVFIASVLLIFYYVFRNKKDILLKNIIGLFVGILLGILYASYLNIRFKNIENISDVSQYTEGKIFSVSNKSSIIEFQKNDQKYRLRVFVSDTSTLRKEQRVNFKCHKIFPRQESKFSLFENLQSISIGCKGIISVIPSGDETYFSSIRKKIANWLENRFEIFPAGSLAKGFLLADTSIINPNEMDVFRKMGIAHLFSASGLHLGLLFGIIFFPFLWLRSRPLGEVLSVIVCTLFLILLDFRLSLLRAYLFLIIYLALKKMDRQTSPFYLFFLVAWISEFFYPLSAFSYSFILSFGITGSILLTFKSYYRIISIKYDLPRNNIALTLSAFTGSVFLSYLLFDYVNVLSFFYNLFLTPLAGIYLGSILFSLVFYPFTYIVSALDFVYHFSAKVHLFLWERHFTQINDLFTEVWLFLILLTIFIGSYLLLQKKYWYVKKWVGFAGIFLVFFYFIQFFFIQEKKWGIKTFPYGVILYENKKIFFSGELAKFAKDSARFIFRRPEVPIQAVNSDKVLKEIVQREITLPLEEVVLIPQDYKNGILKINQKCFLFFSQMKKNNRVYPSKKCSQYYLVQSKKYRMPEYRLKLLMANLNINKPPKEIGYSRWQWN